MDVAIDPNIASDPARWPTVLARQSWGASVAIYSIVRDIRRVADEFGDRVLVGEIWLPLKRLVGYYGKDLTGLQLPFNFQLVTLPWRATRVHQAITRYEALLPAGAWPNWVLGNHDTRRIATRVGPAQARVAAVLLLTLRGTPTLYYGDEIGMVDVDIPPEKQRDPQGLRGGLSRDPCRTPMRWDAGVGAGFSRARPWLPIGPRVDEINVADQREDPGSMLNLHRRLLEVRRREPALHIGGWRGLGVAGSALAYLRGDGERRFLVALNMASRPAALPPAARGLRGRTEIATDHRRQGDPFDGREDLAADEGLVVLLD